MFILDNVPLGAYSTMRLGGNARHLTEINDRTEIAEAIAWADERGLPIVMIGGGSNIIWGDDGFPGLVLVNKILRFETFEEDAENLYVTVGAGENWDSVVERVVGMGYSGLEELSLIPGTAGATPIQNVGAYGRETSDVLVTVEAYDRQEKKLVSIPNPDCGFAYRTSRFRTTDRGRFFISAVTFHVIKRNPEPPFYEALKKYFAERGITSFTPQIVRDAVIDIRSSKLPDPAFYANNGSFFYNPIVPQEHLNNILPDYPDMVYWRLDDGRVKISAAWLIEQAGFKDHFDPETGMSTWPRQPLVLVNKSAKTTSDLLTYRQKILDAVEAKFHITLEQEPEIIP
jgi:UDP-N-acetylmuramate dehydrogenase